ncbi:lysine-specific demethylase JMJ30 [Magnolia sinica]|uniref:lysine-specific demethylase JMJ30 n=1 Tax=Magnolia sinica TaxID=86752 RepID=UPI00265A8F2B|nr:lysine-specific demethylase JMJ30 [Magnolia sinica]
MRTPTAELLHTPTLDAERSSLLQRISEEGGFAYVSVATLAASGDFRAAETAREMAWEQLHSGPWHSVLPVWRDAYSMACLHVAAFHHGAGEFREALRVLDMGLIMGGMLLRKDLDSAIEKILLRSTAEKDLDGRERCDRERISGGSDHLDEAKVLRVLPYRSLSCKIVERRSSPSLESFLRDYFLSGSPVIISDCMSHWPARTKWKDTEYLKRVAGDRTVPVEVGKNYLYPEWKQELIAFSQFLERIQSTDCCSAAPTYLAQHPLFDQIQELRKDIFVPDYCCAGGGELQSLNAWFGPAGTITPLHHDPHHNLFAQVVGRKYIRLYPASITEDLYPYTESMLSNSSQVDLDSPNKKEFPKAQDLDFMDCILEEGEMLYIPPKWWHYVKSLTPSFSVSFWWGECSTPVS